MSDGKTTGSSVEELASTVSSETYLPASDRATATFRVPNPRELDCPSPPWFPILDG